MSQLKYLKPGKTSAVKICMKCIFGVKSAKKNFCWNKNFWVGPLLKGRRETGNTKFIPYGLINASSGTELKSVLLDT